ncbi:hypothetical protein EWM64_g669 [Hericium alpestre]|uniref:Utp14-domain-containing protein n=1 Tax=Hericium alpestre TaxID=135208 RepID=A0A4Z0ACE3_9AGAM|nr:hypothetical protein EWM64_g669 [Hericium alpestre]
MARTGRPVGHSGKPVPSSSKANAAGYQKRQSRKAKGVAGLSSDVYEFQSQKVRRSNVALTLDRDEEENHGGSDDDVDRDALRARLIGENVDDEMIDSDDDEEVDSDAAFEESDEDRFAGFTFHSSKPKAKPKKKQGKAHAVHFADVDLNEDCDAEEDDIPANDQNSSEEEEEEEGDPDEFIDALDILDGHGEANFGDDDEAEGREGAEKEQGGSAEDSESEDEQDEEGPAADEDISLSGDEQETDADALDGLGNFISTLETSKKRKAEDGPPVEDAARRKRRIIHERTEGGAENEFAAQAGSSMLDLDDLLAPLASQSSNMLSLKKSAKALTSSRTGMKLSAPLPMRTQDRLDREAAYEQTKQEVDKWKDTMKRIQEAEHLSFPLQAQPAGKVSSLELAAKFKPTTELESSVDRLLKQAQLREEDMSKTEELKMNHLSVEEVAARRAEVRKVRELMFRAEMKAKRVAKIKSKTYRRIKRKERERLAAKVDGEEDEGDSEVRMRREAERAMERATLKHKNTGKWAKAMKGRGELDVDQRREITEMLERGERLRRRIKGDKSDEEADSSDGSEDEDDGGIEGLKARAFDELTALKDAPAATSGNGKSVFDMKFMQDAAAREHQAVDRDVDDFMKEMGDDTTEDAGEAQDADSAIVHRVGGRVSFRPGNQLQPLSIQTLACVSSDTSSVTLKSTDFPPLSASSNVPGHASDGSAPVSPQQGTAVLDQSNPWLTRDGPARTGKKRSEILVSKESKAVEKSKNRLRKQKEDHEDERAKAKEDAVLEINVDNILTVNTTEASAGPSASSSSKKKTKAAAGTATGDANDSDYNSEVDEQERTLAQKGKGKAKSHAVKAFEQRELVARAFAGDHVVRVSQPSIHLTPRALTMSSRTSPKRSAVRSKRTHQRGWTRTLPGWGAWGGSGAQKQKPKPHLIKKLAGVDPKSRADYGKAHVIISEKRDKKAAKYMVKDLPYPYTSKAQFERSVETPIGTEWNTRVAFQRGTLPKITKKMGTVINPLEKLS